MAQCPTCRRGGLPDPPPKPEPGSPESYKAQAPSYVGEMIRADERCRVLSDLLGVTVRPHQGLVWSGVVSFADLTKITSTRERVGGSKPASPKRAKRRKPSLPVVEAPKPDVPHVVRMAKKLTPDGVWLVSWSCPACSWVARGAATQAAAQADHDAKKAKNKPKAPGPHSWEKTT